MSDQTEDLLRVRDIQYGQSWKKTGFVMELLKDDLYEVTTNAPPMVFNLVLIINKAIRAMHSPYNQDHYRDIIGYAQLILNELQNPPRRRVR